MSSSRVSKKLLWPAVALLIVPVIGAFWFGFGSTDPLPIDNAWHDGVVVSKGSAGFFVSEIFHLVGSTKGMAAVSVLIMIVLAVMKKWWHAIALASTMLTVLAASKIIKFIVDRPRPADMLVTETETSFPSGHSLGAGAIATILICFVWASDRVSKSIKIIVLVAGAAYILIMMWSRTALHVHWLSDTVAGALLGVSLALFYSSIFLPRAEAASRLKGEHQARHSLTKHG